MSKKLTRIVFILIILLFLFTRFYKIGEIPPSIYWDEASIGVNGYSITQTGKDEWGEFLPLHFKAFGEFKLPVYIYATAVSVKLFGLNEFAVRLPSVIFSLGVVILTYFLAKRLFNNITVALFSIFLITISPWFFIFSRTGYEATAGLFFLLLGIFFWLKYQKSPFFIIFSCLSFVFSAYSYNSFRVLLPFLLPGLFLLLFINKNKQGKGLIVSLILGICILIFGFIPIIEFFSKGEGNRLDVIGIFDSQKKNIQILQTFVSNYITHFNPKFLLTSGDINLRSQQSNFGEIYMVEFPFLLMGFFFLYKLKKIQNFALIYFLLISFVPSAITKEAPHALRAILAAPLISIISSVGIFSFYQKLRKEKLQITNYFYKAVILLFVLSFGWYFFKFLSGYNKEAAEHWQYGYKRIFLDFAEEFNNSDNILISDRYNQPYIFALFYLKYDPERFRKEVEYNQSIRKATSLVKGFNKLSFTNIDYYNLPKGKSLIFAHPTDKMDEIKSREVILNPDKSIAVYVYEYTK